MLSARFSIIDSIVFVMFREITDVLGKHLLPTTTATEAATAVATARTCPLTSVATATTTVRTLWHSAVLATEGIETV